MNICKSVTQVVGIVIYIKGWLNYRIIKTYSLDMAQSCWILLTRHKQNKVTNKINFISSAELVWTC